MIFQSLQGRFVVKSSVPSLSHSIFLQRHVVFYDSLPTGSSSICHSKSFRNRSPVHFCQGQKWAFQRKQRPGFGLLQHIQSFRNQCTRCIRHPHCDVEVCQHLIHCSEALRQILYLSMSTPWTTCWNFHNSWHWKSLTIEAHWTLETFESFFAKQVYRNFLYISTFQNASKSCKSFHITYSRK